MTDRHADYVPFPEPKEGGCCIVVGRAGSGKTFLTHDLILSGWGDQFARKVLFCPTYHPGDGEPNLWADIEWDRVYSYYSPEKLAEVFATIKKAYKKDHRLTLVVFDDAISEKDFKSDQQSQSINAVNHTGRHAGVYPIYLTQVYTGISKQSRAEAKSLYIFKGMTSAEYDMIKREHGPAHREKWKRFLPVLEEQFGDRHSWVYADRVNGVWINGTNMQIIAEISDEKALRSGPSVSK